MIQITYSVSLEQKDAELKWLRDQKIFPGYEEWWDWRRSVYVMKFGVIVSPEQALAIKLRHNLDTQETWVRK